MFKDIGELEDKSAAGIVEAADKGVIESGNTRYSQLIQEARALVSNGEGNKILAGFLGTTPQWK